jgi:hypothetical protein
LIAYICITRSCLVRRANRRKSRIPGFCSFVSIVFFLKIALITCPLRGATPTFDKQVERIELHGN